MPVENLQRIVEAHPAFIPIAAAAEFLHMSPESLRASIDPNRCPFGFSWRLGERSGYKIPTITFVSWLTKGTFAPNISEFRPLRRKSA